MSDLPTPVKGDETRLQKRQRGWHRTEHPGFYDVKGRFEDAAKDAHVKIAEAKMRGYLRVLQKYALLEKFDEPIEALAKRFAQSNFGYGEDPKPAPKGKYQGYAGDPRMGPALESRNWGSV